MSSTDQLAAAASGFGRPKAANDLALEFVLHAVRTGHLRAGDQVSPEVIATQLQISHVPVREAIRRLEGRGVLTHVPRKGNFVTELNLEDMETLVVLGRLLETEALERAVPLITDDQLERMQKTIALSRPLVGSDPIGIAAASREFHGILLERGVPRLLLRQLDLLWGSMEAYRHLYYDEAVHQEATCVEHQAILDALTQRDVEKTVDVFNQHRTSINDAITQLPPFADPQS